MSLNIYNPTFESESKVVENYWDYSDKKGTDSPDVLESIKELKILLKDAETLSKRVAELEEAVKEKNESKVAAFVKSIASGTMATLLSKLASENLLQFLGSY